jgi:hypothetical protein
VPGEMTVTPAARDTFSSGGRTARAASSTGEALPSDQFPPRALRIHRPVSVKEPLTPLFADPREAARLFTTDPNAPYEEMVRRASAPPAVPRQAKAMADALGMGWSFREPISRDPQMEREERRIRRR